MPVTRDKQYLVGTTFGKATILSVYSIGKGYKRCTFECSCGSGVHDRFLKNVVHASASCGCLKKELLSTRASTHRKTKTTEYRIFNQMIQRCSNPRQAKYAQYGGRGIKVEWGSFEEFLSDMGGRPSKDHSIDRINNNGNYCVKNCRWATRSQQQRNRRVNRMIECDGRLVTVSEFIECHGLNENSFRGKLRRRGWPMKGSLYA